MKRSAFYIPRRSGVLVGLLLALVLVWTFFNRQIHHSFAVHLLLSSRNPREEFFDCLAKESDDPVNFLQRCWATGKVTHHQLVAAFLKDNASTNSPWLARAEPLVFACATDADLSVRELGLAVLEAQHSPRLFEAVQVQLDDLDPLARLLGLDYLRKSNPEKAVPVAIRLLNDPDLRVVATAEVGLMRWSGEDYGVRARLAIAPQEGAHSGQIDPANAEAIRRGVEQRREWWRVHQRDYGSDPGPVAAITHTEFAEASRPLAPDFTLHDLEGKNVSLSDFRGKVVLLNFWATWCTACLAEIPDLVALQEKLGRQVAIIGVALDGVPDEQGDMPGEEVGEKSHNEGASLKAVRARVVRAVQARRINYRVLLDPKSSVGGQYNGGELPTTVIIDGEGRVRRRFIGERSLRVFEAMVAEAGRPLSPSRTTLSAQTN